MPAGMEELAGVQEALENVQVTACGHLLALKAAAQAIFRAAAEVTMSAKHHKEGPDARAELIQQRAKLVEERSAFMAEMSGYVSVLKGSGAGEEESNMHPLKAGMQGLAQRVLDRQAALPEPEGAREEAASWEDFEEEMLSGFPASVQELLASSSEARAERRTPRRRSPELSSGQEDQQDSPATPPLPRRVPERPPAAASRRSSSHSDSSEEEMTDASERAGSATPPQKVPRSPLIIGDTADTATSATLPTQDSAARRKPSQERTPRRTRDSRCWGPVQGLEADAFLAAIAAAQEEPAEGLEEPPEGREADFFASIASDQEEPAEGPEELAEGPEELAEGVEADSLSASIATAQDTPAEGPEELAEGVEDTPAEGLEEPPEGLEADSFFTSIAAAQDKPAEGLEEPAEGLQADSFFASTAAAHEEPAEGLEEPAEVVEEPAEGLEADSFLASTAAAREEPAEAQEEPAEGLEEPEKEEILEEAHEDQPMCLEPEPNGSQADVAEAEPEEEMEDQVWCLSEEHVPTNPELVLAIRSGDKEMIASLLAAKANVNAVDDIGEPPLFEALARQDRDVVAALIRSRASTCATSPAGVSATSLAGGDPVLLRLLTSPERPTNAILGPLDLEVHRLWGDALSLLTKAKVARADAERADSPQRPEREQGRLVDRRLLVPPPSPNSSVSKSLMAELLLYDGRRRGRAR